MQLFNCIIHLKANLEKGKNIGKVEMSFNQKPLVTIGIPTYNRADGLLMDALGSAINQTYRNIEIIVSDNCSIDNTETLVNRISDPRIKYFRHNKNIGANNNFNYCLEQAKGVYFLLLQDDDMIDKGFIETCMRAVNYSVDTGIIRTGMRRINLDGKILREEPNYASGLSTEDFFLHWFEGRFPMHLCMTLFNTDKLKQVNGFHSRHHLFQDVLAEVQMAAKFGRVDIEDIKASYRMHSEQHSSSAKMKAWCEDSFVLFDTIRNLVFEKKSQLEKKGKVFFFRHNYNIARKCKSPLSRFKSCLLVFREFGYLFSLKQLLYANTFFRKINTLRKNITTAINLITQT